jgi:hypothetical protein
VTLVDKYSTWDKYENEKNSQGYFSHHTSHMVCPGINTPPPPYVERSVNNLVEREICYERDVSIIRFVKCLSLFILENRQI